jgi:trimethylamine--corrinoid protein Co-methyltransferase
MMNRDNRENWEAAGSPDIAELALDKSLDILKNYQPKPRPDGVQKELDNIYAEYEQIVAEHKAKAAAA